MYKLPLTVLLLLLLCLPILAAQEAAEEMPIITEEIEIIGKAPDQRPVSSTSRIDREKIEKMLAKNLIDVLNYTTGTYLSVGRKYSWNLQIRGLESRKISLIYDGIPIWDPYFGSFDLKTFATEEIKSIEIIKGASSVLYGPNSMGGILHILTRRPQQSRLALSTLFGGNNTYYVGATGSLVRETWAFITSASYDASDGFDYEMDGNTELRDNSDYETLTVTSKFYYYPNASSELLAEINYFTSEYGMPGAVEYFNPKYWRFKDWDRLNANLGGTFNIGTKGQVKVRAFYSAYYNILDAYRSEDFAELKWESTYDNYAYGLFAIGSYKLTENNELKASISYKVDDVQTQDDTGEPWETYDHQTMSAGVEDHHTLSDQWFLVGGVSFDYLNKSEGDKKVSLNPLLGVRYSPTECWDFHLTLSRKSRFPTMKELYSTSSGNPDLEAENNTSYEIGWQYAGAVDIKGALFYQDVKDLIESEYLPDDTELYINIGRAEIKGFEIGLEKAYKCLYLSVNYTYLDTLNKDADHALDLVPESQFNFGIGYRAPCNAELFVWGLSASSSRLFDDDESIKVPSYFVLNASLQKTFSWATVYVKGENLLDEQYFTEPGFPMRSRTISAGVRITLGKTSK